MLVLVNGNLTSDTRMLSIFSILFIERDSIKRSKSSISNNLNEFHCISELRYYDILINEKKNYP